MTGRFGDFGIRVLAAAGLALAVMSSPIRPIKASDTAPSPDRLPRNFAVLKFGQTCPSPMSVRPSLKDVNSLPSGVDDELDADIEDESSVTSPPASVSFDTLPFSCSEPYSELASFPVALAARPLRC